MKVLAILFVALTLSLPCAADSVVYSNGPDPGNIGAWQINDGFAVTNSFTLTTVATLEFFDLSLWVLPGDRPERIHFTISSQPFGGTTYLSGAPSMVIESSSLNAFGYLQDEVRNDDFFALKLPAGTYWFNILDSGSVNGGPVYWGENDGIGCSSPGCPSLAYQNDVGSIGSESFDLLGSAVGATPEPGSLALFCGGASAMLGLAWRRLPR